MTGLCQWLVGIALRALRINEREAVLGDLVEAGATDFQALSQVLGLVVRRKAEGWMDWRAWLALFALAIPLAALLRRFSDRSAIYTWMFLANWRTTDLDNAGFRSVLFQWISAAAIVYATLFLWSWCCGFVLASFSARSTGISAVVFCVLMFDQIVAFSGRYSRLNALVFSHWFYGLIFPLLLRAALVLVPFLLGMRRGSNGIALRVKHAVLIVAALVTFTELTSFTDTWWQLGTSWQIRTILLVAQWPAVYLLATSLRKHRQCIEDSTAGT